MDFDNPKVYGDTFISDGLVWMTVTRGAINVMLASKSQLQKVVLPPLRRASQRIGLPPGPPGPPRPTKAFQAHQSLPGPRQAQVGGGTDKKFHV